jgi:uncharacterized caspase-like protein
LLRDGKFDRVTVRKNLGRQALRDTLKEFTGDAVGAQVAFIFYAGHATRFGKDRMLLASDLAFKTLADIPPQGIGIDEMIGATRGAVTRLVVLDTDQKEPTQIAASSASRNQPLDPRGAVVLYSSSPTESASDGDGANSPFVTAFLKHFKPHGARFVEAFANVQRDVAAATKNEQHPAIYGTPPAQFSLLTP